MRNVICLLGASVLLSLGATGASGHGGIIIPAPKPPITTPRSGFPPSTTPGANDVPVAPGTPTTPPGDGRGTPTDGPVSVSGRSDWVWWWMLNGEEILGVRASMRQRLAMETTKGGADTGETPLSRARAKVVAASKEIIALPGVDPDLKAAAVIALARCGELADVHLMMKLAQNEAGHDALVEESAALSLGILSVRLPVVREILIKILDDRSRKTRTRCFAALALGLLEDRSDEAFAALERRIAAGGAADELPVCSLVALGLAGDAGRVAQISKWYEEGRVKGRKLSNLERAHVVGALGRIGDPAALPLVNRAMSSKDRLPRRSAVIAVGRLVPLAPEADQLTHTKALVARHAGEKDRDARNLSLISLGRIGGRPDCGNEVRRLCKDTLVGAFRRSKGVEKSFASLGLGLLGTGGKEATELRYVCAKEVREDLVKGKGSASVRQAQALSLGMLRDNDAVPLLRGYLEDSGRDPGFRAMSGTALGLIGDLTARAAVLKALETERDRAVRIACAVSGAMLGGSRSLKSLLDALGDKNASQYFLGSTALALGRVGELRAVDPLLAIVESGKAKAKASDLVRGFALVALGQIAAREDVRVLGRIAKDMNYHATVPSLEEVVMIN